MYQYASSPGDGTYCYAELTASFISYCTSIIAVHLLDLRYRER